MSFDAPLVPELRTARRPGPTRVPGAKAGFGRQVQRSRGPSASRIRSHTLGAPAPDSGQSSTLCPVCKAGEKPECSPDAVANRKGDRDVSREAPLRELFPQGV